MAKRGDDLTPEGDGADSLWLGEEGDDAPPPRRRRRARQALLISIGGLLGLVLLAAGGLYVVGERLTGNVERLPGVFVGLDPGQRPEDDEGLTFLLVGSDSRSPEPTTGDAATGEAFVPGAQRSDVIMLVRVDAERTKASVVSLPRDSWVLIPGHGMDKINAAYSLGGPALLVQTVEALTRVRVDHFAVIDFAGFQAMTDAVGGIDVTVAETTSYYGVTFSKGVNHLDGYQALAYVRQREGLPRGDLSRVQRQQNVLRALMGKAISDQMLSDPLRTYDLLSAVSNSAGVDDTLDDGALQSLAFSLRNLRGNDVVFLTAPVRAPGTQGEASVVYLDEVRAPQLWTALNTDSVERYLRANRNDALGSNPP